MEAMLYYGRLTFKGRWGCFQRRREKKTDRIRECKEKSERNVGKAGSLSETHRRGQAHREMDTELENDFAAG